MPYSQLKPNSTKDSALLDLGKNISDRSHSTRKSPEAKTSWDYLRNRKTSNMAGVWRIRGADGRDDVGEGVRICWALGSWYRGLGFVLRTIENHWKSVSKGILEATLYLQKTV